MKRLVLLILLPFFTSLSIAQVCVPQTDFGDADFAVAPDTIENFVSGELILVYMQQVDVKVPADGGFLGFEFIVVDSATIVSIQGLPPGLTFECGSESSVNPCTYLGGGIGCMVITGIPEEEGLFELDINLSIHTNTFGTPSSIPQTVTGYEIQIGEPLSTESELYTTFALEQNVPNPANDKTTLILNSPNSGLGTLTIYDLVGKETLRKPIRINSGQNRIALNTSDMRQGLYIYRVEAFGQSLSQRLIISR